MIGIKMIGVGACTPSKIVTNNDLSEIVETSNEWIVERTGIRERRISEGEDTSELATKAAKIALERAKVKGEEIDLIVVATVTPDSFTPSVSCLIQKEIKALGAIAFDINAACSGFLYGFQIAYSMMKSNENLKKALVIGSEVLSKVVDWKDRSTCVLFGDGAGAIVLSKEEMEKEKVAVFHCLSRGDKGEALNIGGFPVENPYVKEVKYKKQKISMEGREVFKFATGAIVSSIKKLLEDSNLLLEDVDYIVPHQANYRIIEYAAKKLKTDINKFYINLDRYGNTSSASIPIALSEMFEKGILEEGKKIILVGFGGGLTLGAALIEL